jgi:hypothetical protein
VPANQNEAKVDQPTQENSNNPVDEQVSGFPFWILYAAIGGGVVVVAIIVVIFCKCRNIPIDGKVE